MRVMRLTAPLAAAAIALGCVVGPAYAGDGPNSVYGFIVGLRQSVSDGGRRAMGEAAGALARLELGAGLTRELRPGFGISSETQARAAVPVGAAFASRTPSLAGETGATATPAQKRLSLQDVTSGASITPSDHSWSLDRARANLGAEIGSMATDPATYLTGNIYRGPNTGAALAEQSYEGRDVELGLPLRPDLRATVAHYWWGERAFSPIVDGYRFSLRYDLSKNLQFEGGDTQDALHGSTGFFGIRYSKPLGLDRLPGVMPLVTPADK